MTFKHISNAGEQRKGQCKDCARSRKAADQYFCAIKENMTGKQSPVWPDHSCVCFKVKS